MKAVDFALMVLGLLLVVPQSMQLNLKSPLKEVNHLSKANSGPYGLVVSDSSGERALNDSGHFVQSSFTKLAGRTFYKGTIKGVEVVYVNTGGQVINSVMTVQLLIDHFPVEGIIFLGIVGSVNDSLPIGSVSVPKRVSYLGSWAWKEFQSKKKKGQLEIGDYNLPGEGKNLLGRIRYDPLELYSQGNSVRKAFWLPINPSWLDLATQLQDLKLEQCSSDNCLPRKSANCLASKREVVVGLSGSSADIFVTNAAYREFLYKQFKVSTVDEESAPIAVTCWSNEKSFIAFLGIDNMAGGSSQDSTCRSSAPVNVLNAVVEFLGLVSRQTAAYNDH